MSSMEYLPVKAYIVHKTDAAVLARVDAREVWIPLSQLDQDEDVPEVGDDAVLHIAEWLVEQELLEIVDDGRQHALMKRPRNTTRRVHHPKLGDGLEVAVEGEKSIVMFGSDRRTILTKFLSGGHKG